MQRALAIPQRQIRRLKWNQDRIDVILGLALMCAAFYSFLGSDSELTPVAATLLVLQTLPIAIRRRGPMKILYITGMAVTVYSLLGYPETPGHFGVFTAFYTVAANETRWRAFLAATITAAGITVSFLAFLTLGSMSVAWTTSLLWTYLSYGVAWFVGDNLRVRRAYTRELEERAAQLEAEREDRTSMAVIEERARIARELHDVVAHYVSVMVVQAAGARRVADKDPIAARGALEAVESAGRTALAEMRRMLEVLRADDPGMGPQPGLGELDRLIDQVRDAGLPVELQIVGAACCLPAGMDLAAYRIVQEALTNTVKHGGKATAAVTIRYTEDTIEIEVIDDGRGAAAPLLAGGLPGGHGLIGMRERVALFSGQMSAGPVLTGGYRVFVRMPIEPDDSARARSERAAALAAINSSAAADLRTQAEEPKERPARPAPGRSGLVNPRAILPMMVRVLPPHPTDQSGSGEHRTREGDL
jgi:signal transduction histidine kinase